MKTLLRSVSIVLLTALVSVAVLWRLVEHSLSTRLNRVYDVPAVNLPVARNVRLGEHVVRVRGQCVACHGDDLSGRYCWRDRTVGRIYAPNITAARLGSWSDEEIARAIRHGVKRDGKTLLYMPSYIFSSLCAEDLAAVVAYLRTVPAVDTEDEPTHLGMGAKVLLFVGKLPNFLSAEVVDHRLPFPDRPQEKDRLIFGRYLAQTMCASCHRADFSGGPISGGRSHWPPAADLTRRSLGKWTEADFTRALRKGVDPLGRSLNLPMPVEFTSQLTDYEVGAIWAYLQTVPAPSPGSRP